MAHTSTTADSRLATRTLEQQGKHAARFSLFVNWSFVIALTTLAVGCGDRSSGTSPSAPSPSSTVTTTSVEVTATSPIRMGQTAQASAVAVLSNGQSQSVTSGWRSDNAAVATVTDAGLITGLANGQAPIYVMTGGRQGQQVIRVVPDYQGEWYGELHVTSCEQTGVFVSLGLCEFLPVNASGGAFDLSLTQTGEAMSVRLYFGNGDQVVAAPIAFDGSAAFAGRASQTEEGITLTLDAAWQINSTRVGALSGTLNEVYRLSGYSGEGRVSYDIEWAKREAMSVSAHDARGRRPLVVQDFGRWLRSRR